MGGSIGQVWLGDLKVPSSKVYSESIPGVYLLAQALRWDRATGTATSAPLGQTQ